MNRQSGFRCWAVLSGTVFLTACGGGGDGSESSSGPVLSFDTGNYASKTVEISANTGIDGYLQLNDDLSYGFGIVEEVRSILTDQSGGVSGTTRCDGGGTATVTYRGDGWTDDETWAFTDCVVATFSYGSVRVSGDYRYVDRLTSETATSEHWEGFERYDITGAIANTGEALRLKGQVDWDQLYRWDNNVGTLRAVNAINAFEMKVGNRYAAITNAEMRLEGTEYDADYSLTAKLIGSAIGGYLQLSTPVPVAVSYYESCPSEGVIRVASDGVAEVRYGSSANGTATSVAVWIDGQVVARYDDCSGVGIGFM